MRMRKYGCTSLGANCRDGIHEISTSAMKVGSADCYNVYVVVVETVLDSWNNGTFSRRRLATGVDVVVPLE
jgi:hypothetical protein